MSQPVPEAVQNQKILVVDDHAPSRYATARILRSAGFEVIEAETGSSALELARDDVGLVVLDVNLPDIDGYEVCRRLRSRGHTAYLPIVHLSATFTNVSDMTQGLHAGADSYLTHPVDPAVLTTTVRTLLFARQADVMKRTMDARFRTIFELASSGIALLDSALVYRDVNPALCALAGRTREQIVGEPWESLMTAADEADIRHVRAQLNDQGRWEGTLPVVRPGGDLATVEWRLAREASGGVHIAIATDYSERRRAEAERERLLASERAARAEAELSNRLKDEFLATLSHELRNPLNAILGWARVLRASKDANPGVLRGLEAIERNSQVQAQLIGDLLDLAGIRSGKMRMELESIEAAPVVEAAVDIVRHSADKAGVAVVADVKGRGARILADSGRLQQIVWNLLTNAVKFTPAGGRVQISADARAECYEIEVADTGRGIGAAFLPHIFDRFSQEDSGAGKSVPGLGIGLAIVKHLVEAHQGTIDAQSAGEGRGSQFRVRIPLTDRQGPRRSAITPELLSGINVLVVEDDADSRSLTSRVLSEMGARVFGATSAADALEQIRRVTPDVLVSDIGMPQQDGYQLLRMLRGSGYSAERLPAIALTAFSRAEDRSYALHAGFQRYLTKPLNIHSLLSAVAELARRDRPERGQEPADVG